MKSIAFVAGLVALAGTALAAGNEMTESGIVVLNETAEGALTMDGTSKVEVHGHAVYVNSNHARAVRTTGTAILDVDFLYIVGGYQFSGASKCTGEIVTSSAVWEDPKAHPTFPTPFGMTNYGAVTVSGSAYEELHPGWYSGGLSIQGSGELMLNPGVYLIDAPGLTISGSRKITGEGVVFAVMTGKVDITGSADFTLTPPVKGHLEGFVIAQPWNNPSPMYLAGTSGTYIRGTIYAAGAPLTMAGTSLVEGEGPLMGDLVIANTMNMTGTSTIRIGGEDTQAIFLHKMPLFD